MGLKGARIFGGGSNIGSIAGANYGSITFCYVAGGKVAGHACIGGIAGHNCNMIIGCYFTGDVTGCSLYAGGLLGSNYSGAICASYASAGIASESSQATVQSCIGIFSGGMDTNTRAVVACYRDGAVNGAAGGGIGTNSTSRAVAEVGGSAITWDNAATEMNGRIAQYGCQRCGRQGVG